MPINRTGIRAALAAARTAVAFGLLHALATPAQAGSIDALRRGGVTLFLRHAPSDWGEEATEFEARAAGRFDPRNCRTQRNLSEEGRSEARALGLAVRSLKLDIVEVDAAALCRAVDTARLAFGEPKIVAGLSPQQDGALAGAQAALERIVRSPTPERALRVVVGDFETVQVLFGQTLGEGDGLILKATAQGKVEVVGEIGLEDWRTLAPVAQMSLGPAATVQRF